MRGPRYKKIPTFLAILDTTKMTFTPDSELDLLFSADRIPAGAATMLPPDLHVRYVGVIVSLNLLVDRLRRCVH